MANVLIVDDHAPVVRVLRLGLESAGYTVASARDGLQCLEMLQSELPDFLVTDIDMPRMTGKELCLAIEERMPHRAFPIIVLTSRTEVEHRNWTKHIANLSFMEKPVSIRRLISLIKKTLDETSDAMSA